MATSTILSPILSPPPPKPKPFCLRKPIQIPVAPYPPAPSRFLKPFIYSYSSSVLQKKKAMAALFGAAGFAALTLVGPASAAAAAAELPLLGSLQVLNEPPNALSLPTWAIHVSSVVEWVTAMALVWQYGEKSGYESWKGLAWGMVPLLGGAFCACTWHFFYNSETLEVLVALQAALTVIGNATMCFAAFRVYKSSERSSKNL